MKKYKDRAARYRRIHSNPKIGKLVTNRQHSFYGFLAQDGRIIQVLSVKKYEKKRLNAYTQTIVGVRIGNLRVM